MKNAMRIMLVLVAAALVLVGPNECLAKKRVASKLPPIRRLKIVAGQPFEPIPAKGPSRIWVGLCPEETEPATFTVSYDKPLENVRAAAVADFVGPGKIPRLNFEVSMVEGEDLVSQVSETSGVVFAQTNIGPDPVQFWVTVTVPRRTPPGVYKGKIGFYYQNKTFDTVPMEVKVLPLRLLGSSKQYVLYTPYGPTGSAPTNLEGEAYRGFLSAFEKVGFRVVSVNCNRDKYASALETYGSTGLTGPVPILVYAFSEMKTISESGPVVVSADDPKMMTAGWTGSNSWTSPTVDEVKSLRDLSASKGLNSVLFFCADNPNSDAARETARNQAKTFKRARVRSAARISDQKSLNELSPVLDGIDYHVTMPYVQSLINKEATRAGNKWEWYWWDARRSALDNRLYAGVGLWKSGLDGCMPAWMPLDGKGPTDGARSMLGEALREGIDDTRYMTTYMKALRELKDLKRAKDKQFIAATEDYLDSFMAQPLDQITPAKLRELKSKMAEYSLKLAART